MSDNQKDNVERLVSLTGFDPVKRQNPTSDLFNEVLGELKNERLAKAKEAAKVQLTEAIQLREQMHKLKNEFNKSYSKFNDQLGKILNGLENSLRQKPQQEENNEETPPSDTTPVV